MSINPHVFIQHYCLSNVVLHAMGETSFCGIMGNLQDLNLEDCHLPLHSEVSSEKRGIKRHASELVITVD